MLSCWLLIPVVASEGAAQGRVSGVLFDSLVTGRPVRGALVSIEGTAFQMRTDSRGRFDFRDVPAGSQTVRHEALWLDSLSLPPLTATVLVRASRRVRTKLATPSAATYHRAVCGTTFEDNQGVLRGEVRDAEGRIRPGIFVGAVWGEAIVTEFGLGVQLMGTVDTTNALGVFTLCGVPRETTFGMRAGADSLGTGELLLAIGARPAARLDLVIGDRSRTAHVRGRVTNERGRPMEGARVQIPGDTVFGSRADQDGGFAFDGVPQRTAQLFVRAIGFTPQIVALEPGSAEVEVSEIVMEVLPMLLDTMRITAMTRARSLDELAFLERQRVGAGVFLDETALLRYPYLSANTLQGLGSGIRSTGGSWPRLRMRSGMGMCAPRFFVDGVDFGLPVDGIEESQLLRMAKRLEIHDQYFMPAAYFDRNGCGVVLIWTR